MRSIATDNNDHGSCRDRGFYMVRLRYRFLIHYDMAFLFRREVKLFIQHNSFYLEDSFPPRNKEWGVVGITRFPVGEEERVRIRSVDV